MLQEEKVNPVGWKRPWGYKTFQRGPSIYITRLLIPMRITPTQITVTGFFIGLAGASLLSSVEWYGKLAGLALLYLHILSDKVDGELARYRKTFSLRGIFWDEINHLVIPPLMWLALASGVIVYSPYPQAILTAGVGGALALVFLRIIHSLPAQIYAKKYLKYREHFVLPVVGEERSDQQKTVLKQASWVAHQFQDFLIIIVTLTLIIIAERIYFPDYIFHPLLAYAMIILSALWTLFVIENIIKKSRSIEREIGRIASSHQLDMVLDQATLNAWRRKQVK